MAVYRVFGVLLLSLGLSNCALTPDHAALPQDWATLDGQGELEPMIERYEVAGRGGWARMRGKALQIGPYSTAQLDHNWWANTPGESGFSIGFGGAHSGVAIGQSTVENDARYGFQIAAQGAPLATIECRQFLNIENWQGGVGDHHGSGVMIEANVHYLATLACISTAIHPDWPQWRLDLRAVDQRPYFGILRVADESWVVAGSQEASQMALSMTTSYTVSRDEQSLMQVDKVNDGVVLLRRDVAPLTRMALMGAAAAMLLANDPLEQ